ncbi:MAG TPA: MFS transporter [Candidatus Didemnitutus sp.]|nr:MFS transporter [Candidatus Didemnitutus sp.]
MKSSRLSLAALMAAQAQVTFNDNAAKLMLIALAQFPGVRGQLDPNLIRSLLSAVLIAPFIAFSPLAGWVVDRFPKSRVLNISLGAQAVIMALLVGALALHSMNGAVACFILLTLQATVFAPAKRGILREMVDARTLSRAVGIMEMLSVTAILVGIFAGGAIFDALTRSVTATGVVPGPAEAWKGALLTAGALAALSAVSWLVFQMVTPTTVQSGEPFQVNLFWRHGRQVAELWRDRPLLRATTGIMFFYALGGYMLVLFLQLGADVHQGRTGSATVASVMALLLGIGTMIGNFTAGMLSRRGVELGLAPLGGAVLAVAMFALGLVGHAGAAFNAWLVVAGFASGFFLVPLYAYIQETAGEARRGRILAAVGLLDSGAGLLANAVFYLFAGERMLGWAPSTQIFVLTLGTLAMLAYALWHLPHQAACAVMRLIGPLFYRVRSRGADNFPAGGALVVCNHLSYVDAVVLQIASPRPLRFVAFAGLARSPTVRFLFRAAGVIPVAPSRPTKGIRMAVDAIRRGEVVCIFPEGAISRTGQLMELKRGFSAVADLAQAPVIPAVIDGLWGSVFSFAGHKYLWKSPRLMPTHVFVLFGTPVAPKEADTERIRRAILALGAEAFEERPTLRRNLARESIRAMAKRPGHLVLVDRTAERREVRAGQMLAAIAVLSRRIRRTVSGRRVGIVLPTGAGAHIANLAVACAGKIPVNLNFTAGPAAVAASLRLGGISTVISADAMRARLPDFPFPENTVDLRQEIEAGGGKPSLLLWLVAAWVLPNQWLADLLRLPRAGDREEAALLFTSGSAGDPKGVVLTHRNLLANCAQISSLSILPASATLLACLPVFHSFGFTVTIWYPLLRGCRVVTVPSPLETRKIVDAIAQEKATVLVAAPTFIRPFLKKAEPAELSSLHLVVTGAEKLPQDLYDAFHERFDIEILQGYGLTETTPVASVNQHDPPITTSTAEHQEGKRIGSVGRLLPGSAARILDPETGVDLPLTSTGILWLKGPNVFPGYLDDPERNAAALRNGWFNTGDLGRIDEQGFLFIEGRLSRFSKIGGEMVPHGTVEQRIAALFDWDQSERILGVVTSIPDPTKGEALVLVTTEPVTPAEIRTRLTEAGLPNLWIPRLVCRVDAIPMLGTGKVDLKSCRQLAMATGPGA